MSSAADRPATGSGLTPGARAHVAVTATTLWVEPDTARPGVDDPSLTNPVDLDAWNANMQETETRRWLTGELESQAVLGSEVIVDEIVGDWAHIV
ncbi:MAG TPA: NlpC/P60 family protein, partial [Brachybacterium sp.]|nr:NlpC/P60 family protein [Brachybacterium sp.]